MSFLNIKKPARAGTMESNDIYIMIQPCDEGNKIQLESTVIKQFGKQIEKAIEETLAELGVKNAYIVAKDRGALDCTIRARIETAVMRAI